LSIDALLLREKKKEKKKKERGCHQSYECTHTHTHTPNFVLKQNLKKGRRRKRLGVLLLK
jgi:hypothetical protein